MKILSRRGAILLAFLLAFLVGFGVFARDYTAKAATWVKYPANKHYYVNGQPIVGTVYDRNGQVLAQTVGSVRKYNANAVIRTALMQDIGDSAGNVSTGVQVVFANRLSGWNLVNGAFRLNTAGKDIRLTLDADLCATAYQALAGRSGTVGVYNYRTGEILCMVSSPSFDPENTPDVKANAAAYEGVYRNRFLSGTYTPGSVFKLVTSAAAIDTISDINQKTYNCAGVLTIGPDKVTCPEVHGTVNFKEALADSCNVAFGQIALQLGSSTLQSYAEKAGFNFALKVDGIPTVAGKVDLSKAKGANLAWAGIGQYTDTANPLNFMAYVGAIANGGVRVDPRILTDSTSPTAQVLSAPTAKQLGDMMRNDVVSNYGDSRFKGLQLCAKTGTAQLAPGQKSDSWFAGYMARSDCPLAFVVVVEHGGWGISAASPIAGTVLQAAVKKYAGK